ncbi:MAG: DNA polymerase III subunit gamma/tau [Acidobacteriota bacterium]|nr:DNA polymerase III subunit gamma/tau [Blastocatellia bacterium]MDW8412732.1 DNA polymerase III subunit gamma/tau [Acidobacteriota bacterium]
MSYQVIARKWRPQRFDDVVGQETVTRTLQNAISSLRLHHAYLFSGPRGCGKTSTARILAKSLNCHVGVTVMPCDKCPSCVEIAAGSSIDVLEIDAASNTGVDNVREVIINSINIAPARERYKIFIIDEVHMLSTSAFNALLKTLEEPPLHAFFILATTELHKVPQTILSRCQHFEFRAISLEKLKERLRLIAEAEQLEIEPAALTMIALAGQGSMRDAQSALDQVISFAGSKISQEDVRLALGLIKRETLFAFVDALAASDIQRLIRLVAEASSTGNDLRQLCRDLMVHLRNLLVLKTLGADRELLPASDDELDNYRRQAELFTLADLVRLFSLLVNIEDEMRSSTQPRYNLEIGLIRLAQAARLRSLEELVERLEALESRLSGLAVAESAGWSVSSATKQVEPPLSRTALAIEPPTAVRAEPIVPTSTHDKIVTAGVDELKKVLEQRRKMLLLTALEQAQEIRIEAEYLLVKFEKSSSEAAKRVIAEQRVLLEVCKELFKRELRLKLIDGAVQQQTDKADKVEIKDPTVEMLLRKFNGDIVEVKNKE